MISRFGQFTLFACLLLSLIPGRAQADSTFHGIRLGTQEVGLSLGPMLPLRVKPSQSTKLFGLGVLPSWSIALTAPVGTGWYEGQFRLGAELVLLYAYEPVTSGSIGLTPKMAYTFTALRRWRPFLEGGGGPVWTELGGQVPEQPAAFNFIVMGGGGLSYLVSPQLALTVGGRFYHISNAGTRSTNRGLNFWYPYLGFSWFLF